MERSSCAIKGLACGMFQIPEAPTNYRLRALVCLDCLQILPNHNNISLYGEPVIVLYL